VALAVKHEGREGHDGHEEINQSNFRALRVRAAWCVVAACLPDIDFAWGRHNMETHSIGFALLVGVVVLAWKRSPPLALACVLSAATHVLFDWLGSDDFPPLGVMALWPFSNEFYFADAFLFEAISRRYWLPGFIAHNVLAVVREVVILGPIAVVVYLVQIRRGQIR
jgi:membrane-bound metal-dependent hydrolase YbcI (DUF457 family)